MGTALEDSSGDFEATGELEFALFNGVLLVPRLELEGEATVGPDVAGFSAVQALEARSVANATMAVAPYLHDFTTIT